MTSPSRPSRRSLLSLGAASALGAGAFVSSSPAVSQERGFLSDPEDSDAPPGRSYAPNPVLFWNDVALQLVALDHSIEARDARAPGPCASPRALGLVHVVMADAAAAVYRTDYEGLLVRERASNISAPDAFIGGAAARILEHIFSTPAHSYLIGSNRQRFLEHLEPAALAAWEAGLAFGRSSAFTSQWDWSAIRRAILSSPTPYVPRPRGHNVDPFNADQGFYGVDWGQYPTLDPHFGPPERYGPGAPPEEGDREYQRDFEEVRQLGVLRREGPTEDQIRVGLFWAYDGPRLIGTPPRLYNQIVRKIMVDDGMSVPEMARCLALCNLAMADGSIVCWGAKYRYNVWRPVVALRHSRSSNWRPFGAPRTNPAQFALGIDARYRSTAQTFMGATDPKSDPSPATLDYKLAAFTPNFPAYPSGHATFGGACFEALRRVRAERDATQRDPNRLNPRLKFVSDELNGISIDNFTNRPRPYVPQSFPTIEAMIEANARSRVHLGVHWGFDCERGSASGLRVAERIHENCYPVRRGHPPVAGRAAPLKRASYRSR